MHESAWKRKRERDAERWPFFVSHLSFHHWPSLTWSISTIKKLDRQPSINQWFNFQKSYVTCRGNGRIQMDNRRRDQRQGKGKNLKREVGCGMWKGRAGREEDKKKVLSCIGFFRRLIKPRNFYFDVVFCSLLIFPLPLRPRLFLRRPSVFPPATIS